MKIMVVLVVIAVAFASGAFIAREQAATAPPMPLTYSNPLRISGPTMASEGERIRFDFERCNNTGRDLAVNATVFWQSEDETQLIALRPISRGDTVIKPGCIGSADSQGLLIPDYVPPGRWRLRGQICYGGVSLENLPETCTGWKTEVFSVVGKEVD